MGRFTKFIKRPFMWSDQNSRDDSNFAKLAGVPVHYDRFTPPYNYGTKGKPMTFYATKEFHEKLERCFTELWILCPFGPAEVITSAGAYTDKPGWHGKGRAFDLDGIFWRDKTFIANKYLDDTKFYLGVNAILLKHFNTVLNYHYDNAHRDHFHIQNDGRQVGFRVVASNVLFLQAALQEIFYENLNMDGEYNKETEAALMRTLGALNIKGKLKNKKTWLAFLNQIAIRAFKSL